MVDGHGPTDETSIPTDGNHTNALFVTVLEHGSNLWRTGGLNDEGGVLGVIVFRPVTLKSATDGGQDGVRVGTTSEGLLVLGGERRFEAGRKGSRQGSGPSQRAAEWGMTREKHGRC